MKIWINIIWELIDNYKAISLNKIFLEYIFMFLKYFRGLKFCNFSSLGCVYDFYRFRLLVNANFCGFIKLTMPRELWWQFFVLPTRFQNSSYFKIRPRMFNIPLFSPLSSIKRSNLFVGPRMQLFFKQMFTF